MVWWVPAPATSAAWTIGAAEAGAQAASPAPPVLPPPRKDAEDPTVVDPVKVVARRGAAEVAPEVEYGADEIDALGASTIGEVIGQLNARNGGESRPVVIINGQRVVDGGIVRGFPPDALVRLEVLPPGAGPIYGATTPGQRVINVVLQRHFVSHDASLSRNGPVRGGTATIGEGINFGRIDNNNFSNASLQASQTSSLRADERPDYLVAHPEAEGSTLRPGARSLGAGLSAMRTAGQFSGVLSAQAQTQDSRSVVVSGGQAVVNRTGVDSLNVSTGAGGLIHKWNVQARASGQAARTRVSGLAASRTTTQGATLGFGLSRGFQVLPAGRLQVNLSGQVSGSRTSTETRIDQADYSSRASQVGAIVSVPLVNRKQWGGRLGELSLGLTASRVDSDAGHGDNLRAGLFWMMGKYVSLDGAWTRGAETPADSQRFAPINYGDPRVVYDFRTGQSVEITPTTGGNPDLRASRRDTMEVGARIGPFFPWRVTTMAKLTRTVGVDAIGGLPEPTAEVEAAFPERFTRDAAGRLVGIDQRPINIQSSAATTLSSRLNLSVPLGAPLKPGGRRRSVQLGLSHTWRLADSTLIRTGLPRMDRLAGDGGGQAGHTLGLFANGGIGPWQVNVAGSWTSGRRSRATTGRDGPNDLVIAPLKSATLSLGYAFNPRTSPPVGDAPVTRRRNRGLALSLDVSNLFDARTRARLGDGRPAPGYGRNDQDPIGRTVRLSLQGRF
jgi:hypothetical protein